MSDYKHILLAVDFSQDSEFIGSRAVDMARKYDARLSLIHVVVDLKGHLYERLLMSSLSDDVESQMTDNAKKQLRILATARVLVLQLFIVEIGSPKSGILKAVEQNDIDLIIVGSHGVGGVDVLLGSTADTVLHKSPVDVLAVRLPS